VHAGFEIGTGIFQGKYAMKKFKKSILGTSYESNVCLNPALIGATVTTSHSEDTEEGMRSHNVGLSFSVGAPWGLSVMGKTTTRELWGSD
ncbi:MAG: hypothetical protein ACFFG0_54945, partial [Candidatus Thorarchaeota archaeon]